MSTNYYYILTDKEIEKKIRVRFPRRNSENITKVIVAALSLNAISSNLGQKRRTFESMGISPSMLRAAIDTRILERTKTSKYRFLVSDRYTKTTNMDYEELINDELKGLIRHIEENQYVAEHVRKLLKLRDDATIDEIKEFITSGSTNKKIYRYDRIFLSLIDNHLYNKNYDYLHLGFRVQAARYLLSDLGKEIIKNE